MTWGQAPTRTSPPARDLARLLPLIDYGLQCAVGEHFRRWADLVRLFSPVAYGFSAPRASTFDGDAGSVPVGSSLTASTG